MLVVGGQLLERLGDGRFQLSRSTIIWNFSKEQLLAEIYNLQEQLKDKTDLLEKIELMSVEDK